MRNAHGREDPAHCMLGLSSLVMLANTVYTRATNTVALHCIHNMGYLYSFGQTYSFVMQQHTCAMGVTWNGQRNTPITTCLKYHVASTILGSALNVLGEGNTGKYEGCAKAIAGLPGMTLDYFSHCTLQRLKNPAYITTCYYCSY